MRQTILVLPMLLLGGCAVRMPVVPPVVPVQIRERTGMEIRPPGERVDGAIPQGVNLADGLTEDEAVAIALWNNAALNADLSMLGVSQADLLDAGLLRNPLLQLLLPTATKPFELWGQFMVEQYWQRPKRVAAARTQWDQVAQGLVQNGLNTARNARQGHTALLQAQERVSFGRQSRELRQRIAEITQLRLRAGDISVLEARVTQADAANALEQFHRFEHDVDLARHRLRVLLGLPAAASLTAVAERPVVQDGPPAEEALREQAWSSRPDLRALEVGIEAAAKRAKWERSRLYTLGALLNSKGFINNGFKSGPGLSFDIPIFKTHAGLVARADAQVEQATRQYLALRQSVDLEVSQSRALLLQAQDSLRDWRTSVLPNASASVEEAQRALEGGDASTLFVLETSRQLIDAQLREVDQQAAVRLAWAELDRSVGAKVTKPE